MVTQLQDVAKTGAQEKISNQRLRNEAIRKQMSNPWSEPKEPVTATTSGTQPLQDLFSNNGYAPTEASTYSRLKNNVDSLGLSGNYSSSGQSTSPSGKSGGPIPGVAAPIVGTMMGVGGLGRYAGLGSSAVNFARGDTASGLSGLTNWVMRQTPLGKITGLPELAGTVASGITKGKDFGEMAKDAAWSLGKSALTKAVPGLGLADLLMGLGTWGVSAMTGKDLDWNPRRGLEGLFSPNTTQPASWQGGFFDPGYRQQEGSYITSGNENYSPYGGSQYNRVGDRSSSSSSSSSSSGYPSTGADSGFDSSTWGGSGGSSGYSGSDSSSSYSNPSSSYGGW